MSCDVHQVRFSCSVVLRALFWVMVDLSNGKILHPVMLEALYTLSSKSSASLKARYDVR